MANQTIIANNQTGAAIELLALGVTIPASGDLELTLYASTFDILDDAQLFGLVDTDEMLLTLNGTPLSKADSLALMTPPVTGDLAHSDLTGIAATDHHSNANDPTSDQKDALTGAGAITSLNPLVSQGTLDTHTGDTSNPHSVTAAQAGAPTTGDLTSHTGNTSNPHSVTAAQASAIPTSEKGAANGVCELDSGGKVPATKIPAVALPEVHVVADETARLALTVQEGDEAIQTDDGSHWIYDGSTWHQRTGGTGDVAGPSSATDNAVARFDESTGKVIQNSAVTVDDSGNIATSGTVDGRDVSADGSTLDSHVASTANPHSVTKTQVGLGNVENLKVNLTATVDPTAGDDSGDGYAVGSRWVNVTDDREWTCLDAALTAAVWQQVTANDTVPAQFFDGYDATGGVDISFGWTDVPLDTERKKDAPFLHIGSSAEVEIDETDTYLVLGRMGWEQTGNNSRSAVKVRLVLDTGGGYVEVPGTLSVGYSRQISQGEDSVSFSAVMALSDGNKIKLQGSRHSGNGIIETLADGSSLVIVRIKGEKGDQGPPGSGTTLTMKDASGDLANTPHSALKVTGAGATFVDEGSGVAALNIPGAPEIDEPENFEDWIAAVGPRWYHNGAILEEPGGVVRLTTSGASGDNKDFGESARSWKAANKFHFRCKTKLGQTANCYVEIGFANFSTGHYAFFSNDGTAGAWRSRTRDGSTYENTDSVGTPDTSYHLFEIIADGSEIVFKIDNVTVATHTTNLPSDAMLGYNYIEATAAVVVTLDNDYMRITCEDRVS